MPPPSSSLSPTTVSQLPFTDALYSYTLDAAAGPSSTPIVTPTSSLSDTSSQCAEMKAISPLMVQAYIVPTSFSSQSSMQLVIGLSVGLGVGSVALIMAVFVILWLYCTRRNNAAEGKPPPESDERNLYDIEPFRSNKPGRFSSKSLDIEAPSMVTESSRNLESRETMFSPSWSPGTAPSCEPLSPVAQTSTKSFSPSHASTREELPQSSNERPPSYCTGS
ncbi:hypothetical protein QCA50_011238 [Cerrena zonata]|uniref:Uncharacterized protein n=1 Tax=Cerrena zonata TaxID=2478898 RepID=A0AAW0FWV4_9APHY